MLHLEDVIQPPPPPDLQRKRQSIIRFLCSATAISGLTFLVMAGALGAGAMSSLQHGAFAACLLWIAIVVVVYFGIGVILCAAFMRRLRLWGGASLSKVVEAKGNFVRSWPFASIRTLKALLLHRMTGGGLPPSYLPG